MPSLVADFCSAPWQVFAPPLTSRGGNGPSHVLFGIDFRMEMDERVALVGRNGAGKSTMVKSLMNAGPSVEGAVTFETRELGRMPAYRRARLGLQLVPEDRRIFNHLTVRENIRIAGRARDRSSPPVPEEEIVASFPMMSPLMHRMGYQLSGGQQQVLAIARALSARPRIMLLDEPTEGVAPAIVEEMVANIRDLCAKSRMGLLLSEQNLWFARQLTDRVIVLDTGRVVFDGSWPEFISRPEIRETHLGV